MVLLSPESEIDDSLALRFLVVTVVLALSVRSFSHTSRSFWYSFSIDLESDDENAENFFGRAGGLSG